VNKVLGSVKASPQFTLEHATLPAKGRTILTYQSICQVRKNEMNFSRRADRQLDYGSFCGILASRQLLVARFWRL
jgi:hypothetical protein